MQSLKPAEQIFFDNFIESGKIRLGVNFKVSAAMPGNKQIADGLVKLYLSGKKTAGSGLVKDYETAGDPLPAVGDFWIVLDSQERPKCIAETVRVEIHPFCEVTEEIAVAEGEGDLSLNYWRSAHKRFFDPYLAKFGISDLDNALVVTEFFNVFFP